MSKVLTDQIEKRTGGTAMDVPATGRWAATSVGDGEIWSVPLDEANRHYQAIQEWVAEGNTIEEAE